MSRFAATAAAVHTNTATTRQHQLLDSIMLPACNTITTVETTLPEVGQKNTLPNCLLGKGD
ncbi:hypothetical protein E2C01_015485 [Portunus trituberculatus]|uniref:Uncharacterized protein n=1 Tax=Portunus trituberculatus TaxID=210409 RepID=A0A5B7DLN3_PORTR|nr:hypothetical protein [Portunus trituberculatus]